MAIAHIDGIEGLRALLGEELGPSEWVEISQERINRFAEVSGDHQWIHVDAERAAGESPYGRTVAHGNLTLSLIDGFREQLMEIGGVAMGINYGWNKVRFPAPVPVDSRVRARAEVISVAEVGEGWWSVVTRFTLESDAGEKPVCVAESVIRLLAG